MTDMEELVKIRQKLFEEALKGNEAAILGFHRADAELRKWKSWARESQLLYAMGRIRPLNLSPEGAFWGDYETGG